MAAEYTYNAVQTVAAGQAAIFNNGNFCCRSGYVLHEDESSTFKLRGWPNCPNSNYAVYQVTVNGNIALPTGATVGEISAAIAVDGEPKQTSRARTTPAAVEEYDNITSTTFVRVPRGCCISISFENTSEGATVTDVPPQILLQNLNITFNKIS